MLKRTIVILATIIVTTAPAFADPDLTQTILPTVTITDIGRPYTVLDGACAFGSAPLFTISVPEMEAASQVAAARLSAMARKIGADAIVGAQASPVVEGDHTGVLVCGTLVKYK